MDDALSAREGKDDLTKLIQRIADATADQHVRLSG